MHNKHSFDTWNPSVFVGKASCYLYVGKCLCLGVELPFDLSFPHIPSARQGPYAKPESFCCMSPDATTTCSIRLHHNSRCNQTFRFF